MKVKTRKKERKKERKEKKRKERSKYIQHSSAVSFRGGEPNTPEKKCRPLSLGIVDETPRAPLFVCILCHLSFVFCRLVCLSV